MARLFPPNEEVEVNMTIVCGGWRQVGPAFQFYEKDDETARLYRFHNQWTTLDGWLPASILRHLPPAYTLPKRFVIKVKEEEGWPGVAIANERRALLKMANIQGRYVPRLLDQVLVEGMEQSALAMELLIGKDLWALSEETWTGAKLSPRRVSQICRGVLHCFDAIAEHHISHFDPELTNVMLVEQAPSRLFSTAAALVLCMSTAMLSVVDLKGGAQLGVTVRYFQFHGTSVELLRV
ncbi:hypothetical protein LTR10_002551 [Elasticomyces elasticus]|nr:hypothetical protein LTR10_002551 [Elasticomyces elasticus]KAK4973394.1 hypothetical protein LTR42_005379 [Elasticomyces elasticus]